MASFRSIKNPVFLATLRLSLFWWLLLAFFDFETYGLDADNLNEILLRLTFLALGVLVGFFYIAYEIHAYRESQTQGTAKGNIRGVFSSLGAPPLLKVAPSQAKAVPSSLPFPPDINEKFLAQWLSKFERSHPLHASLMHALLRVYAYDPSLPATHIEGGHGGRSLFMHSLLVCGLALRLGETWGYSGLRGKSGKLIVPLRDPSYVFTPNDPMVGLVAFAHDIGKIECYIKNDKGRVVDSKFEHDQVGGRMLGRMDEVWAIPDEDRRLLTSVVSFYHRPMDLPLANGGLACDDRTIAIMELLIRADATASRLENGQTEAEAEKCNKEPPEAQKNDLWTAFCELMMQSGRINGPSAAFRLGQKNSSETGAALVYLHESSLRKALAKQMGTDEGEQLGDRSYVLTRSLLKVLHEQGVLYQHHNDASFSDSRALFNVEFHNKKGERLAAWPATIVIEPGLILPSLTNLPDFSSIPSISRATFGAHSAKNKRQDLLSAVADGADNESLMSIATPDPETEPTTEKPKKKTRKQDESAESFALTKSPNLFHSAPEAAPNNPEEVTPVAGEANAMAKEEPIRASALPDDVLSKSIIEQLQYSLSANALQTITMQDGRLALRINLLPESLESALIALSELPAGMECRQRGDRTFLVFPAEILASNAPLTEETLTEAPDATPSETSHDEMESDAAEDLAAEEDSDDLASDCFDEFDEESDEDEDSPVAIEMPSEEELASLDESDVKDTSVDAPFTKASSLTNDAPDERNNVQAAERVMRDQIKNGRIKHKLTDNGTIIVLLEDAMKFNSRWENLPDLIAACGDDPPIQYKEKNGKKALIFAKIN